ncbi:MAG TPA: hypothetical protein VG603_07190 [Chitinophagales bacterium]|nr:hypothetical protein [Chitinophagales bacterium]
MKRHLINKYRGLVAARYDYKAIKNHPDMPEGITPEIVDSLKGYFLGSLYPEPETREKLDAAFAELENYVLHPAKVWDILGNLTSAIFKFGLQFPSALRAGLISLEAYTSAKHFENTLLAAALKGGYKIPVSDEEFYECLTHIPKPELEKFIEELSHLFRSFTNTELLGKTIGIMEDVLARMKSKPDLYGENEVEAIELGLDIMRKGHALFVEYDDEMKEFILQFIANNERNFIESLYEAKET